MASPSHKLFWWRQHAFTADYICNALFAEAIGIERLLCPMNVAGDTKIARRTPACLALPVVLSSEMWLACSTDSNDALARYLKAFMLFAEIPSRILPAMIAAA